MPVWSVPVHPGVHANRTPGFLLRTSAARETEWPPRLSDGCARLCQAASAALRVSDESALPARLPGHPDGTDRRAAAGSGRPACPTAVPTARSCIRVSSHGLYWELKDGWGQLCWATRVGTPSPAARPCRRHRSTGSRRLQAGRRVGKVTV